MDALKTWFAAALVCMSVGVLAQVPIYDEDTGLLTLSAVKVGTATYTNVTLLNTGSYTFRLLNATEQVPPTAADVSYDGITGILNIPAVSVGNATYVNVTLLNFGNYTFSLQTASALASIRVGSATLSPKEGDSVQLSAVTLDPVGITLPDTMVTWSSSDTGIATVSATGLLQTLTTGTVIVTATINGVSGTQALTISAIKVGVTIGAKEVVFDYTTDRCEALDLPDQPARFVRAEDGSLVLIDGNAPRHYVSRGTDFNSLKRDCRQPALASADKRTADTYENWEWLWVVYREGNRWHALIHNEFHDALASTCRQGDPSPGNPCWYNSITYALSTDGGRTFLKPSPPAHVVAPAPEAWVAPLPGVPPTYGFFVEGYLAPSNIVRAADGYYYAFLTAIPTQGWTGPQGLCAIRTMTLGDPASWRAWDGSGFDLPMTSPYATGNSAPPCTFLQTVMTAGHIVYNTYLDRYMQVAISEGWSEIDARPACGFFFSLSADLIHWSKPQLLAEALIAWCNTDPQQPRVLDSLFVMYPSIIDHADTTINFERAGRTPYLYYTRFNDNGLDRDLVRVPLTFTRID